jgi:hypothetical protein
LRSARTPKPRSPRRTRAPPSIAAATSGQDRDYLNRDKALKVKRKRVDETVAADCPLIAAVVTEEANPAAAEFSQVLGQSWRRARVCAILPGKSLKWLAESKTQGGNDG